MFPTYISTYVSTPVTVGCVLSTRNPVTRAKASFASGISYSGREEALRAKYKWRNLYRKLGLLWIRHVVARKICVTPHLDFVGRC